MALCLGSDIGGARLVHEEGALTEVVSETVFHHMGVLTVFVEPGEGFALLQEVEIVAGFALLDDFVSSRILGFTEGIGQLRTLIRLHRRKDLDFLQERLIFLAAPYGGIFHDVVESVAVKLPQHTLFKCGNCCCSRGIIEECQLAEGLTCDVPLEEGWLRVAGKNLRAVEGALADHIQAVALISLLDDILVLRRLNLLHSVNDDVLLLV